MVSKSNTIDRIRVGELVAWIRENKLAASAILTLGGAQFVPPKHADVQMTHAEYADLIVGISTSCQRSAK